MTLSGASNAALNAHSSSSNTFSFLLHSYLGSGREGQSESVEIKLKQLQGRTGLYVTGPLVSPRGKAAASAFSCWERRRSSFSSFSLGAISSSSPSSTPGRPSVVVSCRSLSPFLGQDRYVFKRSSPKLLTERRQLHPFTGGVKEHIGYREMGRFTCRASQEEDGGPITEGLLNGQGTESGKKGPGGWLGALVEPITPVLPENPHRSLINEDFAPALPEQRSFSVWDLASLWVGLVVGIPTYYMAGSLVDLGMAWWQGILTVVAGNVIVLLPMVLSAHGGTKYGIPFPVLSRAAFGIRGANVPSLLRALVGCGWFGIQTWIGGQAIFQLVNALLPTKMDAAVLPWIGSSFPELACFLLFWIMQVGIIWNGIESIREMEKYCAPILIAMSAALLAWAYFSAGGFGPMLAAPSQFIPGGPKEGQFWKAFFPALTANIGFWATVSLNIPDFTRYARSQADQLVGQALGLPFSMAAFTFVGLAVTSATVVIYGRVISDPIEVLSLIGSLIPTLLALVGVILATLTTNIAANVVAPANALVNLNPSAFSFRTAGLCTATLSILLAPWRLIQSSHGFIFTWLIGYSALLGPVGGIIITDYFLLRHRQLDVSALYSRSPDAQYWYTRGFNLKAMAALVLGVLPNIPGFLQSAGFVDSVPAFFSTIYDNAWFVGFLASSIIFWLLSSKPKTSSSTVSFA